VALVMYTPRHLMQLVLLTCLFSCLYCTCVPTAAAAWLGGQGRWALVMVQAKTPDPTVLFTLHVSCCCCCWLQLPGWEDRGVGGPGDVEAKSP
jgi:hypothetical protein